MDFAGTEPWLRALTFVGILAGAATLAWWVVSLEGVNALRQLAAAAAALAAIPAAIVAPIQSGPALTALGLLAIAGFAVAAAAALVPAALERRVAAPRTISEQTAESTAASPLGSQTRVGSYAGMTEVRPAPVSAHTVALAPKASISEIAFLVDYTGDGHPMRLDADNRIGRDPEAEIPVEDNGASREHSRIKLEDGRFVLYDLGSTNGTRLVRAGRRRKLAAPAPLQDLDIIEVGNTRLVFLTIDLEPRA